jgi:ribosomal protein S12 methylthiotransferase accessory factor
MTDLSKPRIREDFRVAYCPGQGLFLYSENDFAILSGETYESVVPWLDGSRTIPELIACLEGKVNPAVVHYALIQLKQKGYVVDAAPASMALPEAAFWRLAGRDPARAQDDLRNATVCLTSLGELPASSRAQLAALLAEHGIACIDADAPATAPQADLTVILTDNYLDPALGEFNRRARAAGQRWLLARPLGIQSWIGPCFDSASACWSCLSQRLAGHRMIEAFLERKLQLPAVPSAAFATLPGARATALSMLAEEIVRCLAGATRVRERVASIEHDSMTLSSHHLTRRPQCPDCGDPSIKFGHALQLQPCPRSFASEGGHRSIAPEETVKRFIHHVSPITGIIRDLTPMRQDGDTVKHIYGAGHNFAMIIDEVSFLRASLRMGSGGKGKTDAQARASAIGEALERYCGLFQGDEPRQLGRMADFGDAAVHPNDFMLFSERQFAGRDESNRTHDRYQYVPEPFDPERTVEWTPLWSLTGERFRYLPTACCYYGYSHHPLPHAAGIWTGYAHADSNGCAAGNTIEEAIFQGLFELVERDSVASWWYTRCQRPAVDLASFDDPYFEQMRAHYDSLGRDLWILDVTNDLGLPTFVAVSCRRDAQRQEITWGCGTHVDARIGIQRALTEVNQFLASFERFSNAQDRYIGFDPAAVAWFESATIAEQGYLLPHSGLAARTRADYPPPPAGDLTDELRHCVAKLAAMGFEVLVLDQTRADVGLPVVRVVVPGLRSFFARLAPGRLYDVPVALGWTPVRLAEDQLNPIPVFF